MLDHREDHRSKRLIYTFHQLTVSRSVVMSTMDVITLFCLDPDVKVNGKYYRKLYVLLLSQRMLCAIRSVADGTLIFQQYNTPVHCDRDTIQLLQRETRNPALHLSWSVAAKQPRLELDQLQCFGPQAAVCIPNWHRQRGRTQTATDWSPERSRTLLTHLSASGKENDCEVVFAYRGDISNIYCRAVHWPKKNYFVFTARRRYICIARTCYGDVAGWLAGWLGVRHTPVLYQNGKTYLKTF